MQQVNEFFHKFSVEDRFLDTERLILKCLDSTFAQSVSNYYFSNKEHFSLGVFDNTYFIKDRGLFEEILWREFELTASHKFLRLFIFDKNDFNYENIIGDVIIFNVELLPRFRCDLGYKIAAKHTGKNYAEEAVRAVIEEIFTETPLQKIEITIHPENKASISVAEKIGFRYEGISHSYVKINDIFHDFLRYYITTPVAP